MCSIILLIRPEHSWPLVLAANRDERVDRPWDPPGDYWPDLPLVVAGRDRAAGGSWLGMNAAGVVAGVLNRPGSLGPAPGKRSRGELPLHALRFGSAAQGAAAVAGLAAENYRTFNMFVGDRREVFWLACDRAITFCRLDPGLWMATAHDPNDRASPRIRRHLPRFRAALPPDPGGGDWAAWEAILGDRSGPRESALTLPSEAGFGTVSASFAALPRAGRPVWRFAPGPADRAGFAPVRLAR